MTERLQVSKEPGEALAIEYSVKFLETSAKASINVEEAFFTLARDIKAKTDKKLEASNPSSQNRGHQLKSKPSKKSCWRCLII